jgi:hypothetical protein
MSRQTSEGLVPVIVLCALFRVSRQGYYAALAKLTRTAQRSRDVAQTAARATRATAARFASADVVLDAIRVVVASHPAWGVRKVWAMLRREHNLRVGKNEPRHVNRGAKCLVPSRIPRVT